MIEHFRAIAKAAPLPMMIYNIPSRTGVNMLPQSVIELARIEKTIVGIKEASGNIDQATEIVSALGPSFDVLSGDDAITLPLLAVGGKGVISVLANIIPKDVAELCSAWRRATFSGLRGFTTKCIP